MLHLSNNDTPHKEKTKKETLLEAVDNAKNLDEVKEILKDIIEEIQ